MPVPEVPQLDQQPVPTSAGAGPRAGSRRRWVPVLVSLVLGAAVGILGTVLHLNFTWVGSGTGSVVLPWGAVLALLLVGATQLWWTLNSSLAWTGAVTAIAAFTTALVLGNWSGLDTFAVALNEYTLAVVPGPAIAGVVWIWGIPVVASVTMVVAQPLLRRPPAGDERRD